MRRGRGFGRRPEEGSEDSYIFQIQLQSPRGSQYAMNIPEKRNSIAEHEAYLSGRIAKHEF